MINTLKKLSDLLNPKEKLILFFLFLGQACVAGFEFAGIASIMPFMAVVTNQEVVQTNQWLKRVYDFLQFTSPRDFLFFLGIVVLSLMVFSNLFKALMNWATLSFDNGLNYKLSHRLLASYLSRPYEFFLNRNTAEMGKNVLVEVRIVISGVLSAGMNVLANFLMGFFIMALLMIVDPLIAVIIIIVLGGCYGLIYLVVRRRLSRIGLQQVESNALKYKVSGEALAGIKDLKILGREKMYLEKFSIPALLHARNNVTCGVTYQLPRYALEIIAFGGILLIVLSFLANEKSSGQIVPILSLYAFAGYRLLPALQQLFAGFSSLRFNMPALDILHRDLLDKNFESEPEMALTEVNNLLPLPFTSEIEFRNVNFRYSEGREPVLRDVSLVIKINTTIGFVGSTGAGKTTIVDILLGLLPPSSGEILVDNEPINGTNLARWQRNLGYVPQTIFLSDDTIARNIAFGVLDNDIDMEAVIRAAKIANLDEFVTNELPEGYETVIGDRGIRLSGGQRQRIGIARALYHDPGVLILDEATSALDGITEEAVMEAIRNLSRQKTIIMIAHRLTTLKDCDLIYVLENGEIIQYGRFEELQNSSDWFKNASRSKVI